ncbi:MAG: hypothetical protein AABW50_04930 [Nanoarchaeota archaeon]
MKSIDSNYLMNENTSSQGAPERNYSEKKSSYKGRSYKGKYSTREEAKTARKEYQHEYYLAHQEKAKRYQKDYNKTRKKPNKKTSKKRAFVSIPKTIYHVSDIIGINVSQKKMLERLGEILRHEKNLEIL